jgi:hypothetical protein
MNSKRRSQLHRSILKVDTAPWQRRAAAAAIDDDPFGGIFF